AFLLGNEVARTSADATEGYCAIVEADDIEITPETVWEHKGWETEPPHAPGAIDMGRRTLLLDVMGVDRQLIFPGFGFVGMGFITATPEWISESYGFELGAEQMAMVNQFGREAIRVSNEWMHEQTAKSNGRLRYVVPLF